MGLQHLPTSFTLVSDYIWMRVNLAPWLNWASQKSKDSVLYFWVCWPLNPAVPLSCIQELVYRVKNMFMVKLTQSQTHSDSQNSLFILSIATEKSPTHTNHFQTLLWELGLQSLHIQNRTHHQQRRCSGIHENIYEAIKYQPWAIKLP